MFVARGRKAYEPRARRHCPCTWNVRRVDGIGCRADSGGATQNVGRPALDVMGYTFPAWEYIFPIDNTGFICLE